MYRHHSIGAFEVQFCHHGTFTKTVEQLDGVIDISIMARAKVPCDSLINAPPTWGREVDNEPESTWLVRFGDNSERVAVYVCTVRGWNLYEFSSCYLSYYVVVHYNRGFMNGL